MNHLTNWVQWTAFHAGVTPDEEMIAWVTQACTEHYNTLRNETRQYTDILDEKLIIEKTRHYIKFIKFNNKMEKLLEK